MTHPEPLSTFYAILRKRVPFLQGLLAKPPWRWVMVYRSKGKGRGKRVKWHRTR